MQTSLGVHSSEHGATLVEYALTTALISAACLFSVAAVGKETQQKFGTAGEAMQQSISLPTGGDLPPGQSPFAPNSNPMLPGGSIGIKAAGDE